MRRQEYWRKQYREQRYCEHQSQDELDDRIRDLVLNLLLLTPDAKVGLLPITPVGVEFTELLEPIDLTLGPLTDIAEFIAP